MSARISCFAAATAATLTYTVLLSLSLIHILKPQSVTLAAEESALSSGFPKMIIAHNHSDGRMIPSAEDRVISRTLSERLRGHGIELCAHYIVSGMDYTEFDF